MQFSEVNDIKTYNLSEGKSIPEWLSDRKKRLLLKKDVDLRRRIQLIQDFEMPTLSNCIRISRDGQYILSTGVYKPRVRCYDVNQLAMKFERCFDSEVVKFDILSEDYTKLVFLYVDRYVEIHSQFGRYYRIRIPKFGRDMAYNYNSCDLYFVGDSTHVYRLNLEVGTFLNPLDTNCVAFNVCAVNRWHNLFVCGSHEGLVEAWDPRSRARVGVLDCALNSVTNETTVDGIPSVTAMAFRDGLNLAVGTATGQILLYDIRGSKPYLVKDHMYGLPIKDVEFLDGLDLVASLDSKIIKLWNRNTGQPFTAIQSDRDLNDLCVVPNSGMMFAANEGQKILSYYIPSIGPAPKWCSFLDRISEELEESNDNTIYDDYKFVTEKDISELGLTHLMGTNLLRAYMHGFFVDIRLYHKAKAASEPFAYEEYRKKKIKQKIESERADRVQIASKLPKVNRELAHRLLAQDSDQSVLKTKKKQKPNLLKDDRFQDIFANPDFEIDEQSEDYRLLHPVVNKLDKSNEPKYAKHFEEILDDEEVNQMSDKSDSDTESDSSDDNHNWTQEVKQQHRLIRNEKYKNKSLNENNASGVSSKFYKLKGGKTYANISDKESNKSAKAAKASFEERLNNLESNSSESIRLGGGGGGGAAYGNRIMTFDVNEKKKLRNKDEMQKHLLERKKLARTAKGIRFSKNKN